MNDNFYWPQVLNTTNHLGYIFHMDYLENISVTPKEEPQDAHFSGKQTSLHCTVVHKPYDTHHYCYHMSDNLTQDKIFSL